MGGGAILGGGGAAYERGFLGVIADPLWCIHLSLSCGSFLCKDDAADETGDCY